MRMIWSQHRAWKPVACANSSGGSSPGHSHTASSMARERRILNSGGGRICRKLNCPPTILKMMPGVLYVVATPIGNLEDITYRAVRVLGEADLIACEDTRHTRKLLEHYGIRKPTISYHEHNEGERSEELARRLLAGESVALVSDAGVPLVSDPGYRLVQTAIAQGIPAQPVPGPSALLAALAASGLPTDAFRFGGFLPAKSGQRARALEELAGETA